MELAAAVRILQARSQAGPVSEGGRACPCCPEGTDLCVFIDTGAGSAAAADAAAATTTAQQQQQQQQQQSCAESLALLRAMETLELLNILTALQGERVETYAGYNKAIDVLVRDGRVEEYPMLCGETTSIFTVLSRRIIEIKEVLVERKQQVLADLVQALQEKEREKLVLVAALHLDILRGHLPNVPLSNTHSMSLLDTPDLQRRIASIEASVSDVLDEIVAAKCDL